MTIRPARVEDAQEIADITNAIIDDTLVTFTTDRRSVAQIASDIAERGPGFLVAELQDHVAGFTTFGPFRSGPGCAQCRELSIQLSPAAQGKGIGRALMVALEAAARSEQIHVLVAGISSANPGAVAFHATMGFTEVGRMPEVGFKWGKRLDLVLMQKILAPE